MVEVNQYRRLTSAGRGRGMFLLLSYALAITLLFAARLHAQEGREAAEISLSKAVLLYDDKKYDEATQLLLKANQQDPRNTNVIYYLALSLNAQGKHAEAEAYLRKGLEVQPKNTHLQYLLAYTLRAQGKTAESRQMAEAIQLDPASPIVGPSRDLLTALKTPRRGDSPFWIEATARGQYDSNVILKPNNQRQADPAGHTSSWGNLLSLSSEYSFSRSEHWQTAARYDMYQTLNYENHDFDFSDHVVGGRVTYSNLLSTGQRVFLTVRPFYDILLQHGRKFLQRPTTLFDSYLYWDRNGANRTELLYQAQGKLFNENPSGRFSLPTPGRGDENRDALNHRAGLVHYIFFDSQRYGLNVGYNYDFEDALGHNWRYSGHRAVAGFLATLPWEIRAATNFEFHARNYDGINSQFGKHRNDKEIIALFNLSKDITPNLTVSLEHLWNNNVSTVGTYSYRRQVYSMGLTWRYY
jgi:tetratricopeptide (TPR) repeat protein